MRKIFIPFLCICGFNLAAQVTSSNTSNISAPPMLEKICSAIDTRLAAIDTELGKAATALSAIGLKGDETRKVLSDLCKIDKSVIDCTTISPAGIIVTVEPGAYRKHEGADISDQEQVQRLQASKKPAMSAVFKAVEGMEAVDIEHPILSKDGALIGSVSVLYSPGHLLAEAIWPLIKGTPLDTYVAQKDGKILYDPDPEEIGLNILTDSAYAAKQPEIVKFFKHVAASDKGQGTFEVRHDKNTGTVSVEGHWSTIRLHGAEWRVIITKAVNGDPSSGRRTIAMLGLPSSEDALRKLAGEETVKKAIEENRDTELLSALKNYYESNRGLYSVQWVDAKGMNRFGYPKENSLTGYDFNAPSALLNTKILDALKGRKETSFDDDLIEGRTGTFFLVPIFDDETYYGMLYSIRLR